ncbi:unnamed protein product [Amoebophrya sp. A25]|nr:unnamed protein product [Amoebophrya sp. A25]|eukprot:GSA25T00016698001.1
MPDVTALRGEQPDLEFVTTLARRAGAVVRKNFGLGHVGRDIQNKSPADLVTEVDVFVEKLITDRILARFPAHKILGEETADSTSILTADPTWIIDPIDGTTNFVHGVPYVAVSIGFYVNFEAVLGVVYNPILDEMFAAEAGHGAWLETWIVTAEESSSGGDRANLSLDSAAENIDVETSSTSIPNASVVSGTTKRLERRPLVRGKWAGDTNKVLGESLVGCGFLVQECGKLRSTAENLAESDRTRIETLYKNIVANTSALIPICRDLRRSGSAACDLASLACGRLDVYFEFGVREWDIAAGLLICKEAGCVVADFDGKTPLPRELNARRALVAVNSNILQQVAEVLVYEDLSS